MRQQLQSRSPPRREQSGERDISGQITQAGDVSLRTRLYQAATAMLNHERSNWLTAWALRVAGRREKTRPTVALARCIGVVLHRMWRDGTEVCVTRADAMAQPKTQAPKDRAEHAQFIKIGRA